MDRRSRERFIESNNQISALVEKFKLEGGPYRKYAGPNVDIDNIENHQKIPLTAYGRPGFFSVLVYLIHRSWSQLNLFRWEGFKTLFLKLLLMPSFFFLLGIFYFQAFQDVRQISERLKCTKSNGFNPGTIPKNLRNQERSDIQQSGWSVLHSNHHQLHDL